MMITPSQRRTGAAVKSLVLGIAVLIGMVVIAIPVVEHRRREIQLEQTLQNLKLIAAAKESVALRKELKIGDTVTMADLIADGRVFTQAPGFPRGVTYSIGKIGELPTAMVNGRQVDPIKDRPKLKFGDSATP